MKLPIHGGGHIGYQPIGCTMLVPLSVEDCMTRDVETTDPETTIRAVARELVRANVGSLVVCDDGEPVGIVTEADLVAVLADAVAPDETTVRSVMSDTLVTVGPEATLERAAMLFATNDVRRLPVVADGELVGIVTTTDLADYLPHLTDRRRRAHRDSTAEYEADDRRPATNPEMAYDQPDWEFESHGEEDGVDVGDVVRFRKELTDADVRAFAEASGDTNRLHLDEEFAARTRFGERVVHGVLTTGIVSAALARLPGLTIYLSQDLRFMGSVRIGEVVTAVCRVTEDLGRDKYRLEIAVYDEDGDVVVEGGSVVLVDPLPKGVERPAEALD